MKYLLFMLILLILFLVYLIYKILKKNIVLRLAFNKINNIDNLVKENNKKYKDDLEKSKLEIESLKNKIITLSYNNQNNEFNNLEKLLENKNLLEELGLTENVNVYKLFIILIDKVLNYNKANDLLLRLSVKLTKEELEIFNDIYEKIIKNSNKYEILETSSGEIYDNLKHKSINEEKVNSIIDKVIFKGYMLKNNIVLKSIVITKI